jgi:hypothetical protein
MSIEHLKEGIWDRLKTKYSGAKTSARNIAGAVKNTARGVPIDGKNVESEKIKYRFSLTQNKLKSIVSNVNTKQPVAFDYKAITSKTPEKQLKINAVLADFVIDLAKELGRTPNQVINILKTNYAPLYTFLSKAYNVSNVKAPTYKVTEYKDFFV